MMRVTLLAGLALAACTAFGQNLTLHLVATDSQGRPLTDLTAADLRITDDGKPAAIAAVQKDIPRSTPPVAGEYTNRPPGLANVNVVLFDLLNLPASDRRTSADQLVRALQKLDHPESTYLYVLSFEGQLIPVRPLPNAAPLPAPSPWVADVATLIEKAMGPVASQRLSANTDVVFRSKTTYGVLENLAARMAPMPGRKTISWITIGMALMFSRQNDDVFDGTPYLRQTAHRIAQSGVALYPIFKLSGSDAAENRDTLQAFADLTGGKLYQGGDIERALPEIAQSSQASYRVQFAPRNWDGKFHKVRATSSRTGVSIQCEQGYQAEKPAPVDPNASIVQGPFDAADLGIRVTVSAGAQPNVLRLHLNIDSRDLHLDGPLSLNLSVTGYLPDGKTIAYAPTPLNLNLTPEQREKARDGLRLGHDVTVASGMRKIRLAVEDRGAKATGTVTIPVAN